MEARTARTLRTEAQLNSTALFGDTSHQAIDKGDLKHAWLAKTQTVFRNALAMCGGAHLRVLRAFDKKVYDLATQSLPGFRAPHRHYHGAAPGRQAPVERDRRIAQRRLDTGHGTNSQR